jgi:hypothetical protein
MFGYIASKKFGESQIWDYASVVIYAEIGYDLKCYRGKVFSHKLMDVVQSMEIGMQVEFAIFRRERYGRVYTEFTMIRPSQFDECSTCLKPVHGNEVCTGNSNSERLEGVFEVIHVDICDRYNKIVLRGGYIQFTFLQWDLSEFTGVFTKGDKVKVIGWRTPERITKVRMFAKCENDLKK